MSETRRVLITGPRAWTDRNALAGAFLDVRETWPRADIILVSGAAEGFDTIAEQLVRTYSRWMVERHPVTAEGWRVLGRRAPLARNEEMVAAGADVCIAGAMPCTKTGCDWPQPHGTHGTAHCAKTAAAAGIRVRWYVPGPELPDEPPCPQCGLSRGCQPGACLTVRNAQ